MKQEIGRRVHDVYQAKTPTSKERKKNTISQMPLCSAQSPRITYRFRMPPKMAKRNDAQEKEQSTVNGSRVTPILMPRNAVLKDAQVIGAGPAPGPRARWRLHWRHVVPARPRGMRDAHHLTCHRIRHGRMRRDTTSRHRGCDCRALRHGWRRSRRYRGGLRKYTRW